MIARIRELERIACRLEPEAGERGAAAQAVIDYAEEFLHRLPQAPALCYVCR